MRVLAIDPGTNSLGWAILSGMDDIIGLEDYGALQFDDGDLFLTKMNSIYAFTSNALQNSGCNLLMLEKTWRIDRNSLALVAAIKIIKEVAELVDDIDTRQALAVSVRKQFGCGARKSDVAKENTKRYVMKEFGVPGDMVSDVYDAILLGLYAFKT